jgi:hypothetical protein
MKIETWYSASEGCTVLDVDELLTAMGMDPDAVDEVGLDVTPQGFVFKARVRPDAENVNITITTDAG